MRWVRRAALALAAVLAVAALMGVPPLAARVQVGLGYAARHMCSCQFVGGRSAASCADDLALPGMDRIAHRLLDAGDGVEASLFGGLVSRVARHREGSGCFLE